MSKIVSLHSGGTKFFGVRDMKAHQSAITAILAIALLAPANGDEDPFGEQRGNAEIVSPSRIVELQIPVVTRAIQQYFDEKQIVIERVTDGPEVELKCTGAAIEGHRLVIRVGDPGTVLTAERLKDYRKWLERVTELVKEGEEISIPENDNFEGVGMRSISLMSFGPEAAGEDFCFTTTDGTCDITVMVTALADDNAIELKLDPQEIASAIDARYNKDVRVHTSPPPAAKSKSEGDNKPKPESEVRPQ